MVKGQGATVENKNVKCSEKASLVKNSIAPSPDQRKDTARESHEALYAQRKRQHSGSV